MKRTMIDPPSGWRYGFPKPLPAAHRERVKDWLLEQGYPRWLTENESFSCRIWEEDDPQIDLEDLL